MEKRNSQLEHGQPMGHTDSQWGKHAACFARATQVWFTVNYNTSSASGE